MGYVTKDSGKRIKFESGFVRDVADDKPRYDLIWRPMLKRWAELMTRGAKKYGTENWKLASSKEEADRFKSSAFRHFIQWLDEEEDEDHAAAILFNVMAYEYMKNKGVVENEKRIRRK